jgi:hypothetical protein
MLRRAISLLPDGQWKTGDDDYLIPVRLVYHILKAAEGYVSELPREELKKQRRYGLNWLGETAPLPSKGKLLEDIEWIQDKTAGWLAMQGDAGLLESEELYPHTGQRRLDKSLYLLRHTQFHIGELMAEVRRRGLYKDVWR